MKQSEDRLCRKLFESAISYFGKVLLHLRLKIFCTFLQDGLAQNVMPWYRQALKEADLNLCTATFKIFTLVFRSIQQTFICRISSYEEHSAC